MVPWGQGALLTACRSYLALQGHDRWTNKNPREQPGVANA